MGNDISDVQRQHIFISLALVTAISPNFRMVHYELEDNHLTVWIYLEHEDGEDFEEIQEFEYELVISEPEEISVKVETIVTDEILSVPPATDKGWCVFKRRESPVE